MIKETIHRTIEIEGGFQADPVDRGNYTPQGQLKGTKYGISARAYPKLDIEAITKEQAYSIYKRDYWSKVIKPSFPEELKPMLFDMAVNHGVRGAVKILQRSVGAVDDGICGPKTMRAVLLNGNLTRLSVERCIYFAAIVQKRPSQAKFIRGWNNRVKEIVEFTEGLCLCS